MTERESMEARALIEASIVQVLSGQADRDLVRAYLTEVEQMRASLAWATKFIRVVCNVDEEYVISNRGVEYAGSGLKLLEAEKLLSLPASSPQEPSQS